MIESKVNEALEIMLSYIKLKTLGINPDLIFNDDILEHWEETLKDCNNIVNEYFKHILNK